MKPLVIILALLVAATAAVLWWRSRGRGPVREIKPTARRSSAPGPSVPTPITSRYADMEGVSIQPGRIPENLRHLLDLARVWAIGDDVERERFIKSVSFEEKKAFVDAVDPLQDALSRWSEEHRNDMPVPDEVVLYDMMAETAAEAVGDVYPSGSRAK